MSDLTDYGESAVANHFFRGVSTTATAAHVGLLTAAPSESAPGTEVSGGSYARVAAGFGAPSPAGVIGNASAVVFPTASGSWGTVTHVGLYDAASGGNLLAFKALAASVPVSTGQQPQFASGALTVTVQ